MPSKAFSPTRVTSSCATAPTARRRGWISSTATVPMCSMPPTPPVRVKKGKAGGPTGCCARDRIHIDQAEEVGTADHAVLEFKGVPLLPIPYISFPLSDKRKSGLLPPTLGLNSVNGFEYAQPYYWNIAPNRDATLQAAIMAKRGVQLGGEFRYLEPSYQGQVRADVLPGDRLRDRNRWSYSPAHTGASSTPVGAGWGSTSTSTARATTTTGAISPARQPSNWRSGCCPAPAAGRWARCPGPDRKPRCACAP